MEPKIYTGFGETHTLKEWAQRLEIRAGVLGYLIETAGKSVEEIAAFCGKKYPSTKRIQKREGSRMSETRDIIAALLKRSGYSAEPHQVGVTYTCRTTHVITYAGRLVGEYDYATGKLSGGASGQTLKLNRFYLENAAPRIRLLSPGGWEPVRIPHLPDVSDTFDEELKAYYNAKATSKTDREG